MNASLNQDLAGVFHKDTQEFFKRKRVLVTGGGGFIGSHVVEQVIALGAHVIVLSRSGISDFLRPVEKEIEFKICDLTDLKQTQTAFRGIDIILHLAADVGGLEYNIKKPASIFDHNMRMALNVLDSAEKNSIGRVFLCSSACVYPRNCIVPTPEEDGFKGEPEPTNSGYGWSKRMLELLGQQYEREFGLSVAVARPYNAYGPRDDFDISRSHVIPALIRKAIEAKSGDFNVWGSGVATRAFLYVEDFARGVIEVAARMPNADPVNIGVDDEVEIKNLAEQIADLTNELTGLRPRPVFNPNLEEGQPRRNCDTRKAKRLLGFEACVSLNEGLRRTIKWYLEK